MKVYILFLTFQGHTRLILTFPYVWHKLLLYIVSSWYCSYLISSAQLREFEVIFCCSNFKVMFSICSQHNFLSGIKYSTLYQWCDWWVSEKLGSAQLLLIFFWILWASPHYSGHCSPIAILLELLKRLETWPVETSAMTGIFEAFVRPYVASLYVARSLFFKK